MHLRPKLDKEIFPDLWARVPASSMVMRLGLWIPLLWVPLCVREYYAPPKSKRRLLDRYNIYVLAMGHLFHLIWGTEEIDDWIFGFLGALAVELLVWEVIGNSPFVKKKIRDDSGDYGVSTGGSSCPLILTIC